MIQKTVKKTFSLPITPEEERDFGKKAANLSFESIQMQDDFESMKKVQKSKIDAINQEIYKLQDCLRTGRVDRLLEVTVVYDYDAKSVAYVNSLTGEEVESRPMTFDEHQMHLQLNEKPKSDDGEGDEIEDADLANEESEDENNKSAEQ